MGYENIKLEKRGAVAVLTLCRPKALNALNGATFEEISAALAEVDADPETRALIITGEGEKAFAAGADIMEINAVGSPGEGVKLAMRGQRALSAVEAMNKPVIAAINGFALGAGCELALACDIRIAADNARLGLPEVNLGILPGCGGTQRLPRLVGKGMAKLMIFTGEAIGAEEARSVGLVEKVVPAASLLSVALEIAESIAAKAPQAVALAKSAIEKGMECDQERGLHIEVQSFAILCSTEDRLEGTKAFMEKRKPSFTGR